jgi:hypothetical protein
VTPRRRQRGAALLLLLVIAVIAFTMALLSGFGKWETPTTSRRNVNADVLAQAKAALIGYVAKEALDLTEDVPGRLPCPEALGNAGGASEGIAAGNCGSTASPTVPAIGRLPWRTLGADKLSDAAAEPLWYAVSPGWVTKTNASPPPSTVPPFINAGTTGTLSFDGTSNVVAVIFAPGKPLSINPTAAQVAAGCAARNQVRTDRSHVPTSGVNPDYRDYLECQNGSSPIDTTFGVAITGNETNLAINDQAVVITDKEILNAIQGPVAERLQRTVAPLLSEYADKWVSTSKFMPYAVAFSPPEAGLAIDSYCGTASLTEGLLPLAPNSSPCASTWTNASLTGGSDVVPGTCSAASASDPVVCKFQYYQFASGLLGFLGITGPTTVSVTVQARATHAAVSFRNPLSTGDFAFDLPAAGSFANLTYTPRTDGDTDMSVQATLTGTGVCRNGLISGLACTLFAALGQASLQPVQFSFPQLGTTVPLSGSKLSTAAKNAHAGPFDLLAPADGDPNYWFIQNEWYRYTYYAVAPGTSAAQSGGALTVNLFPANYGAGNDKRFVLTLMGPAVTGQARSATSALSQYVEGNNASAGTSPRKFDYQVFTVSGNDRIATCPFTSGTSICD